MRKYIDWLKVVKAKARGESEEEVKCRKWEIHNCKWGVLVWLYERTAWQLCHEFLHRITCPCMASGHLEFICTHRHTVSGNPVSWWQTWILEMIVSCIYMHAAWILLFLSVFTLYFFSISSKSKPEKSGWIALLQYMIPYALLKIKTYILCMLFLAFSGFCSTLSVFKMCLRWPHCCFAVNKERKNAVWNILVGCFFFLSYKIRENLMCYSSNLRVSVLRLHQNWGEKRALQET